MTNPLNPYTDVKGIIGGVQSAISGAASESQILGSIGAVLLQKAFWIRVGVALLGSLMALFGLILVFRHPIAGVGKDALKVGGVAALA